MPFPNTRLIPRGLAALMAPIVAESFTAEVDIRHPDTTQTRDAATGRTTFAEAAPYYAGAARVQGNAPGPDTESPAGRQLATASYLVAVPWDVTGARIGDIVRVHGGGDDPSLAGLVLKVTGTWSATLLLQRNLRCELVEPAQKGTA